MTRGDSPPEELVDAALDVLADDPELAVSLARRALARSPGARARYVLGVALIESGELEEGLEALQDTVTEDPNHVDAWVAIAGGLFDALQFESAAGAVAAALRLDPLQPDALYLRACLRERRGDRDGAARAYQAAALADPDTFPVPVPLGEEEVELLVESVLETLHPSLRRYLADVAILLEEVPPREVLAEVEPPASPTELLGCFSGNALTERAGNDAWSALPASIHLYRCNLARLAHDRDHLHEELRITVLHEIGHFLGLDEEDLEARGLD
jgi:predicted Zn-dependent protease with MMP-like domain